MGKTLPVTLDDFLVSLTSDAPPPRCPPLLVALWHDKRGDWDAAHRVAQDVSDANGSWVHAYLHRKEGDAGNAAHWYRQAGQPVCKDSLDDEWTAIVRALAQA